MMKDIFTVSLILFSVINSIGTLPYVIQIKKTEGDVKTLSTTFISGSLMLIFLFLGNSLLNLLGLDISSFALAGSIIMFLVAAEMIMGVNLMKEDTCIKGSRSIVPLAFPMLAGAGTLTTLISLQSIYAKWTLIAAILINTLIIYLILRSSSWIEKRIGCSGFSVLKKVFGIVVLAIAVKIAKTNGLY